MKTANPAIHLAHHLIVLSVASLASADETVSFNRDIRPFCYNIAESPVHLHDFQATLLHLLGIDHERLTFKYQGRRFRLTDVHGHVVKEILA